MKASVLAAKLRRMDRRLLSAIMDEREPEVFAEKLYAFYHDRARADRTSRDQMYLHLGMCCGRISAMAERLRRKTR